MLIRTILIISLFFIPTGMLYSKPLAGVSIITSNTGRAKAVSDLLERHLIKILEKTDIFSTVQYGIVKNELKKFKCISEKCILGFSSSAKFSLIITGDVRDRDEYILITLRAFGSDIPHNNKLIDSRKVKIKLKYKLISRDFSLICEEHAGKFLAAVLKKYLEPVYISDNRLEHDKDISGTYPLYTTKKSSIVKLGNINIVKNNIERKSTLSEKTFILLNHKKEANKISDYYTNEKKKIVFKKTSLYDTFYFVLFTVPASATMPIASPFLGYASQDDWAGLGLWTVNAAPYLYAEARGFINKPADMRSQNKSISRDDLAMNYFAWYMLLAGGTPLFIDAFSHDYLDRASYYTNKYDLMGNPYTAAYLSLISNGGGHFYRGHRSWGYFYFHLNNVLLYMTLRQYAEPETYDSSTDQYIKKSRDRKKLLLWGSALAISKTVEVIHAVLSKDSIECGEEITDTFNAAPILSVDTDGKPVYGLSFTYRY